MQTRTIHFEVVEVKGTKRWVDASGKKRQKTKTFSQTINPWNVNEDGTPKTYMQIKQELIEQRDRWLAEKVKP